MRIIGRALLWFAAALSLALFGATASFWVRTWDGGGDEVDLVVGRELFGYAAAPGRVSVYWDTGFANPETAWRRVPASEMARRGRPDSRRVVPGVEWYHSVMGPTTWRVVIVHPAYVLTAPLVLPAVLACRAARGRRRAMHGHCRQCGYDVRATPDAGGTQLPRCPECGAVVP
jgi:hypothetical protein